MAKSREHRHAVDGRILYGRAGERDGPKGVPSLRFPKHAALNESFSATSMKSRHPSGGCHHHIDMDVLEGAIQSAAFVLLDQA